MTEHSNKTSVFIVNSSVLCFLSIGIKFFMPLLPALALSKLY